MIQILDLMTLCQRSNIDYDKLYLHEVFKIMRIHESSYGNNFWLAGGALRRIITNDSTKTGDFDFFFRDEQSLKKFSTHLHNIGFKLSKKTIHHEQYEKDNIKIQLIHFKYYSSIEEVIDSFDFSICQLALSLSHEIYVGDYTLWDIGRKRLAINKISYPLSTLRRVLKYNAQGYTACNGCLSTILTAVSNNPKLQETLSIAYVD